MTDKNDVITFRIESDTKRQFAKYCKDNFTTPSQMLYSIIHQKLKYSGKKDFIARIPRTKVNLNKINMKIIQVLVMLAALTFVIKQVQLLLKQQIDKCDELPEIEEEEM